MISKYTGHRFQGLACIALGLTSNLLVSCTQSLPFNLNTPAKAEMKSFSKVLDVGTDVATWFLFHPQDLAHRDQDPLSWWAYDFALTKEFLAGNLVAVSTGSDGGFSVRLTNQDLTSRERPYATYSQKFRLQVRHDRLLLDGGDSLPNGDFPPHPEEVPATWLDILNGNYEVTVHVLAWDKEPGAVNQDGRSMKNALSSYVVVFKPVAQLEAIVPPKGLPQLEPDFQLERTGSPYDDFNNSLAREYPVFDRDNVFFPSLEVAFSLNKAEYDSLRRLQEQFSIVVSPSAESGTIGTLIQLSSYGSGSLPSTNFIPNPKIRPGYEASGISQQFVQIVRNYERQGMRWIEVKPYKPPSSPAADSALRDRLKQLFASYAATDTSYQNCIKHHRFYAERVASLTKPIEVAWAVANALDLPLATQHELVTLSEKELLQRLSRILDEK